MQYKVVPFTAKVSRSDSSSTVAAQVQTIIDTYLAEGWEYQRMEVVETSVAPTSGCFGLGAQPGYTTAIQILIFRQD